MAKKANKRKVKPSFEVGNQVSRGHKGHSHIKAFADAARKVLTPEEWEAMVRAMCDRAKDGDVRAFEAITSKLLPPTVLWQATGAESGLGVTFRLCVAEPGGTYPSTPVPPGDPAPES